MATMRKPTDGAVVDVHLRLVIMRPVGPVLERLADIARKRPTMFFEVAHAELVDNINLAYIETHDGERLPLTEPLWRLLAAAHPDLLVQLMRALGNAVLA
jgi:hypothetical protein